MAEAGPVQLTVLKTIQRPEVILLRTTRLSAIASPSDWLKLILRSLSLEWVPCRSTNQQVKFALYHLRLAKIETLSKIAVKLMKLKGRPLVAGKDARCVVIPVLRHSFTNQLPGNDL